MQAEFDGELDAAEALRAAQHRQTCAECRRCQRELAATHALMRESAPRYQAPESLRRAIARGLNVSEPCPAAPPPPPDPRGALVAHGCELRRRRRARRRHCAVRHRAGASKTCSTMSSRAMSRALQPGHLEDVVSTDQHTVKPWFDGKLDFAPPVKDLAAKQFPLLGGRLDYLEQPAGRGAGLSAATSIIIDFTSGPGRRRPNAAHGGSQRLQHRALERDGMDFWAVSDLEAGKLSDFVRDWRAAG